MKNRGRKSRDTLFLYCKFTPCVGGSQQEQEEPPGEGLPQVPGGGQHLQGLHAHGRGKS